MENTNSYLTYKIGDNYFASNVSNIQAITEYTQPTRLPGMPDYVLGVVNQRGIVLPVIDTRIRFAIENKEITSASCILVSEVNSAKEQLFFGALVDAVSEVIEIPPGEIKSPPAIGKTKQNNIITGIYNLNNDIIMIVDIEKLTDSDTNSFFETEFIQNKVA